MEKLSIKHFSKAVFLLAVIIFLNGGCNKETDVLIDPTTTSAKPNILLIIADDLGIDLSAYRQGAFFTAEVPSANNRWGVPAGNWERSYASGYWLML